MNHIDIKVTVWNRMKFHDESDMQKVLEILKTSGVDYAIDNTLGFQESETLYDTEEQIETAENGGASTIEVYRNDELIWENGTGQAG